jgi:preprotein translocase subunit SecD
MSAMSLSMRARPSANLDVAPDTGKRIQAFSEQNVGRSMAFIIDGRVISTPKIKDPITGNGILIGPFDRAEAERLAGAIKTGCIGRRPDNSILNPTDALSTIVRGGDPRGRH